MVLTNFQRLAIILLATTWALFELYPPKGRDLIEVFQEKAIKRDATFEKMVADARKLRGDRAELGFDSLRQASTNVALTNYFPTPRGEYRDLNRAILNKLQREAAGKIKLGLDLQGGTQFLVEMDAAQFAALTDKTDALTRTIEVLRKRVDASGVAEPIIQPVGESRILIQLPGLSEAQREDARTRIQKAAFLEFRIVHPDSSGDDGLIKPGYELMQEKQKGANGAETSAPVWVKKKTEMTGEHISRAQVSRHPLTNEPEILFELDEKGAEMFGKITQDNLQKRLAIVLDGELISAPTIQSQIRNRGQITGSYTLEEARQLASALENPLKTPVKIIEERDVDPSLGRDSIQSGLRAAIYGVIAVAGFMAGYYLLAGMIANVALLLNIVVLLGIMCSVGTTLTLPGIAGIVLTIGMAVDANVLIYERLREELALGKTLRGAISAAYDRAFSTIFDSHVTTLIASVILIYLGTGPVKGFGVALTIGVAVSLFTALIVTRFIFEALLSKNLISSLPMFHLIKNTKIDFMRWAVPAFILSWTLIAIGNGYGIYRGKDALGVDFQGGDNLTLKFSQADKVASEEVRKTVDALKIGESTIQYQKDLAVGTETLRITTAFDKGVAVQEALVKQFPKAKFERYALDKVGPTVGAEITKSALLAAFLAMFGILVYVAFRYEFSFAVGAVVAITHDVLMTTGWFFLSGRELSAPIVAAVLTIIGFSINDTVVIFDRIREDLKLGVRGSFRELVNQALNQTLSRTIITSGTVFLATFSLYLFGGGVINDFSYTFLVGIITGTYSSIYIASALVVWWHKGQRPQIGAGAVAAQVDAPVVKA